MQGSSCTVLDWLCSVFQLLKGSCLHVVLHDLLSSYGMPWLGAADEKHIQSHFWPHQGLHRACSLPAFASLPCSFRCVALAYHNLPLLHFYADVHI